MKAKKSKGKAATKRAAKDLPPKNTRDAKGGSASSGAGAGKAKFEPFVVTKQIDTASTSLIL